ncbi:type II secretion system protein [Phycisphaerales bacterium AB-hyl4]|uniref:Type II secretion system protein n=1 Tax=Natronomicrosphaera hydrolytica TaxID=3242702 RepID=A0ABV4U8B8_9BACT
MHHATCRQTAFSLIELLVAVSIVAILVGMLLPVLAKARESGMAMQCQGHLRSMQFGWLSAMMDDRGVIPWTRHLNYHGADGYPNWVGRLTKALTEGPEIYGTSNESFNSCPTVQRRYPGLYYATRPWGYVVNSRWESGVGNGGAAGGQVLAAQPAHLNQGKNWEHIHRPSRYPWFMDTEVYRTATDNQAQHFAPSNRSGLENWGVGAHHNGQRSANISFADGAVRAVDVMEIHLETIGGDSFGWFENR